MGTLLSQDTTDITEATGPGKPRRPARLLYIQHAGDLGGSCMSLLYTMQALDRTRYEPIVALIRPTPAVARLYRDAGFEVIEWPGIRTFEHTTLRWWPLYSPAALLEAARLLAGWSMFGRI
jgi:hypothetical protein